jgi:hypothetical protein
MKPTTSTYAILATILGIIVFKQFDFGNLKFEKTGLGIIYLIGFAISFFLMIKSKQKNVE